MALPRGALCLLIGGTLSVCLLWHRSAAVSSPRRRLRPSSAATHDFITPLGRDPDVVQIDSKAGAFYRDPGAVCEQTPASGHGKPRDLSEYVVIGGDLVDVSQPGSYKVTYECKTAPTATRTVLVSAAGCANVRVAGVSFLLDGVYTLTNSVLNGRGVYEQECGGNFMWWLNERGANSSGDTTAPAPHKSRFVRGQRGQWRISKSLSGFHSAHAEGVADTPEEIKAGTWTVQRGTSWEQDADGTTTCASAPAKGYCFTKFHEHKCHLGVQAAAAATDHRQTVKEEAVRACIDCARRHEATLHSAGCAYLQVVKLCDRFGVLMEPPDATTAQVLMPSVLSEEHGCDANGNHAERQAEEERLIASPLATAFVAPEGGRAAHQSADCAVSQWGTWSSCSVSCGHGTVVRGRRELALPRFGGKACPQLSQQRGCISAMRGCTHDAGTPHSSHARCANTVRFGKWSKCNANCGAGIQLRLKETVECAKWKGRASIRRVSRQQRRCNNGPCAGAQPSAIEVHVAPLASVPDDDDDDDDDSKHKRER